MSSKNRVFVISLLFTIFVTGGISIGYAQEKKETPPTKIEMLSDTAMEKLRKSGEASDNNRILASLSGEWYFDLHYWSNKDAAPQLSTGNVVNEMIFNNKFLSSKVNVICTPSAQVGQIVAYC